MSRVLRQTDGGHPLIRRLGEADLDRICEIERLAYPHPWSRGIFADCLRGAYSCFGLQTDGDLQAYAILNWAAEEAHLLNLCVHPDRQRQGYGSLLLEYSISQAARSGNLAMYLEVRAGNSRAMRLYLDRGFKVIGHRRGYYQSQRGREDAVVMRLDLRGAAAEQA